MKLINREPTPGMIEAMHERGATLTGMFQAAYDAAPEMKQEPVAWRVWRGDDYELYFNLDSAIRRTECFIKPRKVEPLYTFHPNAQAEIAKRDASIEEYKQDLQLRDDHIAEQAAEISRLKALVGKCEEVVEQYTTREQDTMNGSFRVCCSTRPNEPHSNCDAQEALAAIKEEVL